MPAKEMAQYLIKKIKDTCDDRTQYSVPMAKKFTAAIENGIKEYVNDNLVIDASYIGVFYEGGTDTVPLYEQKSLNTSIYTGFVGKDFDSWIAQINLDIFKDFKISINESTIQPTAPNTIFTFPSLNISSYTNRDTLKEMYKSLFDSNYHLKDPNTDIQLQIWTKICEGIIKAFENGLNQEPVPAYNVNSQGAAMLSKITL